MGKPRHYIPALRFASLTRFYDPVAALATREDTFKRRLLAQAGLQPRQRVLDLGCGTGTLAVWASEIQPSAEIAGLDGDPAVLWRARAKARRAKAPVPFARGLSYDLPFPDGCFDRVLSSLFFHHLLPVDKLRTLNEVVRVLRPGGELHVADWGRPTGAVMRACFFAVQVLDGFATTRQNVEGRLPELFRQCGLERVEIRREFATMFGTLTLYSAQKPPVRTALTRRVRSKNGRQDGGCSAERSRSWVSGRRRLQPASRLCEGVFASRSAPPWG